MHTILTAAGKDLRLLARDRAGLLVLFVMPAILVVVITLVQENILALSGQRQTEILLLDHDQGAFSQALRASLLAGNLRIRDWERSIDGQDEALRGLLAEGREQAGIIIAAGTSHRLRQDVEILLTNATGQSTPVAASPSLEILFDPATMAGFRAGLRARVEIAALRAEMELKIAGLGRILAEHFGDPTSKVPPGLIAGTELQRALSHPLLSVDETAAAPGRPTFVTEINPVDQNVPAWALFGMFFIAIPIAGTILEERRSGIAIRLAGMPVSPLSLLTGKMVAYLGVCIAQFLLISLIGVYLFPHLGLPAFSLSTTALPPVAVLVCACGLAAGASGMMLGTFCRSFEQASTLGATLVVTAAAMGGVMVPVYAMPELMQTISILSPLNWGVNAFSELLVRNGSFATIAADLIRLLLFSMALLILSWQRTCRWGT